MRTLVLASSSTIRATLLRRAGLAVEVRPARIDEQAITESLVASGASAHDIADALAEHKALRIAGKAPGELVLGCDQLLECEGKLFAKPSSVDDARAQLGFLRGKTHRLHTAVVLFDAGQPVWRHVSTPRLTMRMASPAWIDDYLHRNWDAVRHCVGCYQIEAEGIRLFSAIEGDLFSIQGLPLLALLDILLTRQEIAG